MMPKKRQALIEFTDITSAISCVNDASRAVTLIAGQPAYLNYSTTQKIVRTGLAALTKDFAQPTTSVFDQTFEFYTF